MAYRKTAGVKAHLKTQREAILDAALFILAKHGREGFTGPRVHERAGISMGSLYNYFPDMNELWAGVVAAALARDIGEIHKAAARASPWEGLSRAIAVFYATLGKRRLARSLYEAAAYRQGIRAEFEKLLAAVAIPARARAEYAAGMMGALQGLADVEASEKISTIIALRAIGVSEETARAMA